MPERRNNRRSLESRLIEAPEECDDPGSPAGGSSSTCVVVKVAEQGPPEVALALNDIAALKRDTALAFHLGIGRIIVERIFQGDLELLRKRGPKDRTLRQLVNHPDLPVSRHTVYVAAGIYELTSRLGEVRTSGLLEFSHYEAVLPAPAEEQPRLLTEASHKGWSVRELKAQVGVVAGPRKGGPRQKSAFAKATQGLRDRLKTIAELVDQRQPLGAEELRDLRQIIARAQSIAVALQRRLGTNARPGSEAPRLQLTPEVPRSSTDKPNIPGQRSKRASKPRGEPRPSGSGVEFLK